MAFVMLEQVLSGSFFVRSSFHGMITRLFLKLFQSSFLYIHICLGGNGSERGETSKALLTRKWSEILMLHSISAGVNHYLGAYNYCVVNKITYTFLLLHLKSMHPLLKILESVPRAM